MTRARPVPLGPVDVFHVRTHQEMIAEGLAGNCCALAIELDGHVDLVRLSRRLTQALRLVPELRWRLGRDAQLRYVWRTRRTLAPPLAAGVLAPDRDTVPSVVALLDRPIGGADPWRIEVLRGPERDVVVGRWFHPLTDARGGLRLLRWLGTDVEDDRLIAPPASERFAVARGALAGQDPRERVAQMRAYFRHIVALAEEPIVSLHSTSREARLGPLGAVRLRLTVDQTAAFDRSLRRRGRMGETSVLQVAAGRLLERLLAARGQHAALQLAPVPVSLDPKKGCRRMLGNNLSMMMLALDAEELADEAKAVTSLARQRREIVRARLDLGMLAALQYAGYLPARLYNWSARRPLGGERCSFVLSNPGPLRIDSFLGHQVLDAFCAPTTLTSPGLQIAVDRFADRLNIVLVYRRGLATAGEMEAELPRFARDLLDGDGGVRPRAAIVETRH